MGPPAGSLTCGGPFELEVADGFTTRTVRDVLIGDVWVCSGQSNMVQTLAGVHNAEAEIAAARHPRMRLFNVPHTIGLTPQHDFPAGTQWVACTPETARTFSAVAYFMGRELHKHLDAPIGLISASWVNTSVVQWISAAGNSTLSDQEMWLGLLRRTSTPPGRAKLDEDKRAAIWLDHHLNAGTSSTAGISWTDPRLRLNANWKRMKLPSAWENAGHPNLDGTVYFRKEVHLPAEWADRETTLSLAHIYDLDTTWFNGQKIGGLDDWQTTRVYQVPASLMKKGRNVIAVRVTDIFAYGGIAGKSETMSLETTIDGQITSRSIAGEWRYRISMDRKDAPPYAFRATEQWPNPSAMYNGMIAPVVSHSIRGVAWFQGESDSGRAKRYRALLRTLIKDWRARWKQPNMPFVYVQIANMGNPAEEPGESEFAELRESQDAVSNMPGVGMVTAIDLGEDEEPHFRGKRAAGERLALAARAVAYGEAQTVYQGPRYIARSLRRRGNRMVLRFETTTGGLIVNGDGNLQGFAIAGADKEFEWANGRIVSKDTIEVWSDKVKKPVAVRYAWGDNPRANLAGTEGLPAFPFRTDEWPEITAGKW